MQMMAQYLRNSERELDLKHWCRQYEDTLSNKFFYWNIALGVGIANTAFKCFRMAKLRFFTTLELSPLTVGTVSGGRQQIH